VPEYQDRGVARQSYRAQRAARHATQDAGLDTVMALPERARATTLYALWPERLPRRVSRKIPASLRQDWRALRSHTHDARWAELFAAMDQLQHEEDPPAFMGQLLDAHGVAAAQILALVDSLPDVMFVAVTVANRSFQFEGLTEEPVRRELLEAFALSLEIGGGIIVRQRTALRTQVMIDGQSQWLYQQRVYGVMAGQGQWNTLTEAQMRQAYMHDQAGQPLPHDPGTVFGDLKNNARRLGLTGKTKQ
jgi:hypothetical protein